MIYFKACPRCRGDMAEDRDAYGFYVFCVQCGYQRDLRPIASPVLLTTSPAMARTGKEVPYERAA